MKIRFTFKDPNALEGAMTLVEGTWTDISYEDARKVAEDFFEYGEYALIEIDTEANTARVVLPEED